MKKRLQLSPFWSVVLLAGAAFVGGVLIFNFAIMPSLVGHGNEVRVPDLKFNTLPQAERVLKEHGLKIEATHLVFDPDVPKGCVISQYPPALSTVKKSRVVKLRISSGELGVSVPDVRGQSLRHAELVLGRAGLQLGRISQVSSELLPPDAIVSTFPAPGALAEEAGSVDLLVSTGPPETEFMTPNLVGQSLAAATRALEKAGLVLRFESGSSRSGGRIAKQSPPYGTRIKSGTAVYVSLGRRN